MTQYKATPCPILNWSLYLIKVCKSNFFLICESYPIDFTIKYWMEKGAPANKLVMGMPLYGQAFTLDKASENGLNAPARQKGKAGQFTRAAGFLAYYEICEKVKSQGWTVVKDEEGRMGPYAYQGRNWVGYDDVAMIKYKSEYIRYK